METLLPFEKIKREIVTKIDKVVTSAKYGCDPYKRPVEQLINYGIINVDKPKGPTSHQVSAYVQKILDVNKSGHSGTLDPKVTGVLPVALGNATRIVQTLLNAGKEYITIMHLHKEVDEYKVHQEIRKNFMGKIKQLPPIKSAIKRQWRYREIYYFNILEQEGQDVLLQVGCEAGTYIRKLLHDLGKNLGVGGHMAELRRTKAAGFTEEGLYTLQDITDAYHYWKEEGNEKYIREVIKPVEYAVAHLPKIWILDSAIEPLCHGTNLAVPGIVKLESPLEKDQVVAILSLKGELVAIGKAKFGAKEILEKDKGIAVSTDKVFMVPGTYPRMS